MMVYKGENSSRLRSAEKSTYSIGMQNVVDPGPNCHLAISFNID